ncbi:WD domain, G-beta repeat protein [Oesophagostomum dentatum]|uniref:WD domain, G-beta repeat protein n=1 Tax=Oesophagostomum dentatum TaxID=61180 RepID=A0A0B1SRQ1_OESDE|nr:WD domain, G-beta repeat protein [Oesophagostomum dentatum]
MLERLLVASSSSDPFSVVIVDPRTGVASWSYKGSELQGAAVGHVEPLGISGDHLVLSIKDRPLIHAFAVHPRDRYHQKSVVSGVIAAFCSNKEGSLLFAAVGTQIFIWLLLSGELLSVTDVHYQAVAQIALSADDSILFTASVDGSINVYLVSDLVSQDRGRTVEPLRKWRAHTLAVKGLSISRGSNPRIVSCGLDHLALIHSITLDDVLLKISADRPLTACLLDAAESRLFLGSDTGNIAIINLCSLVSCFFFVLFV